MLPWVKLLTGILRKFELKGLRLHLHLAIIFQIRLLEPDVHIQGEKQINTGLTTLFQERELLNLHPCYYRV